MKCLRVHFAATAAMLAAAPAPGGFFYANTGPGNVPWPGGLVPYQFDASLAPGQTNTLRHGLLEWTLAANLTFVPRSNQTRYLLLKYDPHGPNRVSGANPLVVEVNRLSRAQVAHEVGHALGFNHENIRPDQATRLLVLTNNIQPGQLGWFIPDPTGVMHGGYDFESVMHLGRNFASLDPATLDTQQARPGFERFQPRMGNLALSPADRAAAAFLYGPPAAPPSPVVTNTRDFGAGSLRAALYAAADQPGTTVTFNLPPTDPGFSNGVFTIQLTGHLPPVVADGTVVDGSTQPGFAGRPLIFVDGSALLPEEVVGSVSGLLIYAANCAVKHLAFTRFNWNGLTLLHADATNNTIAGCWCGLDATGADRAPNDYQGILIADGASRNLIGGAQATNRNVLSGNSQYGLFITDSNTSGNVVLGNYVGADVSGSFAVSNAAGGAFLGNGAASNLIGGAAASARNVFSGNHNFGLWLGGGGARANLVQGNFFGLNAAGTAALPNSFVGMHLIDGARSNTIRDNVFSGNFSEGLRVSGPETAGNVVQGNLCGVSPEGTSAIPNGWGGLTLFDGANANLIGGLTPGARNVCSGNGTAGLVLGSDAHENVVLGNFIGTDVAGGSSVPNGFAGVLVEGAWHNSIGGPAAGAGNVVSGNWSYGLFLSNPTTRGNRIQGNFIGTAADGATPLANGMGILLTGGAGENVLGWAHDGSGAGNRIAFNLAAGARLETAGTQGNTIRGNAISDNGGLGLDLAGGAEDHFGVTANDATDADDGANGLQNFPVLTDAFAYPTSTTVRGVLRSTAGRGLLVDIYRNPVPDPSGHGEGRHWFASIALTTDASGSGAFTLTATGSFPGQHFTATATDLLTGDTSEFSRALLATNAPPPPVFAGPCLLTSTGFVTRLLLNPGQSYRVQATTNLARQPILWADLTNFTASASNQLFRDRDATNQPLRFYRTVSP